MNINQLMQQAQKMQKDMQKSQAEVAAMTFTSKQDLVEVEMSGDKVIKKVTIDKDIEKDDIEALEDMLVVAINDAQKKIDTDTEKKMGKFGNIPGLF